MYFHILRFINIEANLTDYINQLGNLFAQFFKFFNANQ